MAMSKLGESLGVIYAQPDKQSICSFRSSKKANIVLKNYGAMVPPSTSNSFCCSANPWRAAPTRCRSKLSHANIQLVTSTVTEGGYYLMKIAVNAWNIQP